MILEFRFAFFARDFARSVAFYRDTLGMTYISGWDRIIDAKGALLLAAGSAVIEIYGAAEGTTYQGPSPVAINLALRVADPQEVDGWHQKLLAAGVPIVEPPQDRFWGHRSFVFSDPDGIPIHIYCELAG